MKYFKLFAFTILALLVVSINVNAQSVEMTASEFLGLAKDKAITLENDVTLTTSLKVDGNIDVLDLNNYTITANAKDGHQIDVSSKLEIKNGTIVRNYKKWSLLNLDGENASVTVDNVVFDGKEIKAEELAYVEVRAHAINLRNGASIIVKNSILQNNQTKGIVGGAFYADGAKSVIFENSEITNSYASSGKGSSALRINNTESVKLIKVNIYDNNNDGTCTVAIDKCGEFIFDKDSVIKNNKAAEASGIHITNTNSIIEGIIEDNEATSVDENGIPDGNGGAIYTDLNDNSKTIRITENAIIRNNTASASGGGIYVNGQNGYEPGLVIIEGATIAGNKANGTPNATTLKDGGGAGIYVRRGSVKIVDAIIKDNVSKSDVGNAILVSHANGNPLGGKLEIVGGTISGSILVHEDYGTLTISGGTFTQDMKDYVLEGLVSKKVNENYVVGKENNIKINTVTNGKVTVDKTKAVIGESVEITTEADEGYEVKSIEVVGTSNTIVPVKDNKFTMPNAEVTITVLFSKITTTVEAPVIKLDEKKEKVEIGVIEVDAIEKVLLESLNNNDTLKDLAKDESVKVSVEVTKIDISQDEESKITEEIKKKYENIVVSEYFDITVAVKNTNNEKLGELTSLTDKIQFVVALSEELKTVEEGKVRKYYIIRQHGDVIEYINDVKLSEDGKSLIFTTDKFSTYAIAYEELNEEEANINTSPQTGDNIIIDMFIGISAVVLIAGTIKYIKKKKLFNV